MEKEASRLAGPQESVEALRRERADLPPPVGRSADATPILAGAPIVCLGSRRSGLVLAIVAGSPQLHPGCPGR